MTFALSSRYRWPAIRLTIAFLLSLWLHLIVLSDVNSWRLTVPLDSIFSMGDPSVINSTSLRASIVQRAPVQPPVTNAIAAQPAPIAGAHAALAGQQAGHSANPEQANVGNETPPASKSEGSSNSSIKPSPTRFLAPANVDVRAYPVNPPNVDQFKNQFYGDQSVRLRVYVDATGHVDHAEALRETNATPEFIQSMIESLTNVQFAPATLKNQAVDSYFDVDLSIVQSHAPYREGNS